MNSLKITDVMHLTQRIRDEYAKIEGNEILLHQVHKNIAKRINICIANDGKHIEDIIRIKIKISKKVFYVFTYFSTVYIKCAWNIPLQRTFP